MAANSQSRGIASFGKRFVNQIWSGNTRDPSHQLITTTSPSTALRSTISTRGAHFSVYDKNVDDQLRPTVVPDDVIQPESDKYWGPHPKTGVFGPATEKGGPEDHSFQSSSSTANADSVLEQKAWFRPLEDIEKPQQH